MFVLEESLMVGDVGGTYDDGASSGDVSGELAVEDCGEGVNFLLPQRTKRMAYRE